VTYFQIKEFPNSDSSVLRCTFFVTSETQIHPKKGIFLLCPLPGFYNRIPQDINIGIVKANVQFYVKQDIHKCLPGGVWYLFPHNSKLCGWIKACCVGCCITLFLV